MLKKSDIGIVIALNILSPCCQLCVLVIGFHLARLCITLNSKQILIYSLFLCTFLTSFIIFHYLSAIKVANIANQIKLHCLPNIFANLIRLPITKINHIPSFEFARLMSNYEQGISIITKAFISIGASTLGLLLVMVYLCYCSPQYALTCLLIMLVLASLHYCARALYKKHLAVQIDSSMLATNFLNQVFSQIDKIKITHLEPVIYSRWRNLFDQSQNNICRTEKIAINIWLLDYLLFPTFILSALIISASLPLLFLSYQIAHYYHKISSELATMSPHIITIQYINNLIQQPVISTPPINHLVTGDIKLINVNCRHLKDINLHIPAGSFIGITGASGAGKSTLLRLMLGLENEFSGTLSFDDLNIADLNTDHLHQQFGVVLQTTTLFPGTIFSNIALNQSLTLDDAWQLAQQVNLAKEIDAMPMKMFTYISDQAGYSLSSGQQQKILLARALARKPRIVFLDEATTFLDETSEAHFFTNLKALPITKIMVTHRVKTLTYADCVYNLDRNEYDIMEKYDGETRHG